MPKYKILEAAEKLFVEKGFDGTSVRELAKAAGVNVAMISYYFGSKENLLEAILEHKTMNSRTHLESLNQKNLSPEEKLNQIIDYYVDYLLTNRQFHLMMNRELTLNQRCDLHERILKLFERNWQEIRATILYGQEKQVFKENIDIDMVIVTMFGHISHSASPKMIKRLMGKFTLEDEEQFKTRVKNHLKNLLHDHLIK